MRYFFIIVSLLLFQGKVDAQILTPVKWSYGAKRISDNEAVIFFKATIDKGWHIYSCYQKVGGPSKTSFAFTKTAEYGLAGNIMEPNPIIKYDSTFLINVLYFENSVVFQQKIKLKANQIVVRGKLNYMACNDHQCLPPEDVQFSIPVK